MVGIVAFAMTDSARRKLISSLTTTPTSPFTKLTIPSKVNVDSSTCHPRKHIFPYPSVASKWVTAALTDIPLPTAPNTSAHPRYWASSGALTLSSLPRLSTSKKISKLDVDLRAKVIAIATAGSVAFAIRMDSVGMMQQCNCANAKYFRVYCNNSGINSSSYYKHVHVYNNINLYSKKKKK